MIGQVVLPNIERSYIVIFFGRNSPFLVVIFILEVIFSFAKTASGRVAELYLICEPVFTSLGPYKIHIVWAYLCDIGT